MLDWTLREGLLFVLLTFRMGGLMVFTPFFGSSSIPARVRILFSILLAYAVFGAMPRQDLPGHLGEFFLAVIGELTIGAAMGLMCLALFSGVQYAGQLIDQQLGFALSELIDPFTNQSGTLTGQVQYYILMLIFLFLNGHLRFLEVFLETVSRIPLGHVSPRVELMEIMSSVITGAFYFAFYFAAPVLGISFLINLALGFASRAVPQMNVLILGFPIKILIGIGILMIGFGQLMARAPDMVRDAVTYSQEITNALIDG